MLKRIPHALPLLFFAVFAVNYSLRPNAVFNDGDCGWHLAAGDLIRTLGAWPRTDPWSFTAGEFPWYNLSWLFDVGASALADVAGLSALFIGSVLLHAALAAILCAQALKRGAAFLPTVLAVGLGGSLLSAFLNMRPAMVSEVLALAFFLLCRRGLLWPLPLLMLLWVNTHGLFVAGFTVIGAFGFEALAARDFRRARAFAAVGLACVPVLLLNPIGYHIYEMVVHRTAQSVATPLIAEWAPTHLYTEKLAALWLALFIAGFALAPVSVGERLLALFWVLMALSSQRFWGICLVLSTPMLALALSRFAPLRYHHAVYTRDMQRPTVRLASVALAVAACGAVWLQSGGRVPVNPAFYPENAVAFLRAYYPGERFINHYNLGGGIVYLGRGEPPVFVDGRAGSAYPEQVLADDQAFFRHCGLDAQAEAIRTRYRAVGAILPAAPEFAAEVKCWDANPAYEAVFRDRVAVIYVKR